MLTSILARFRGLIENVAPSPGLRARREALALQAACCGLLMEVARLDSPAGDRKRKAVSQAMWREFGIPSEELAPMLKDIERPENRLTSYFKPVDLINKGFAPEQKVQLIERLWSVALADGGIDMYEEQLIRKLADLLYVPHADFILAKHRVQSSAA
ncbi:MAG: tellurite resistance TerB family protein [Burkholderiales bacterium]